MATLNPLLMAKGLPPSMSANLPEQQSEVESPNKPTTEQALFSDLRDKVTKLNALWQTDIKKTEENRALRYVTADRNDMIRAQLLKEDEIYIPIRIVNDNITKEAAQYISYLTSSRNAAIFKPKAKTFEGFNADIPQERFTDYVRFPGWEIPFFKVLDGAQLHGWDSVEIEFDSSKPGHFNIIHISHENLWFAKDLANLQVAPLLVRNVPVTKVDLSEFQNVNEEQIQKVFENTEQTEHKEAIKYVQKVFYKDPSNGIVMVCWLDYKTSTDFIRSPKPLFFGRMELPEVPQNMGSKLIAMIMPQSPKKIYETAYPIEPLPYITNENGKIADTKGRAFMDEYVQEATSSLISSIVNSWHRASKVFASPGQPTGASQPELTDIKLIAGKVYNMPMEFFHMPYPDISGLELVQGLVTQNKQETSQVNYAVTNREDSRKTAKEIQAVQSEAALLSGVQVTLYSIFLRNVFTRCWSITHSQLEQGLIVDEQFPPEYLSIPYELMAAGDVEVIKRQELISQMQMSWGVFQQTPAAQLYLEDLTALLFPQQAQKYIAAMRAGDQKTQAIQAMGKILMTTMEEHPELFSDEDKKGVIGILSVGAKAITPPGTKVSNSSSEGMQTPEQTAAANQ